MTIDEIFKICGGKDEWHKYHSLAHDSLNEFVKNAKLDHSEESFNILKTIFYEVIDDIEDSWYRQSLGKTHYH